MKMARNARTFERIKKIILRGRFNKEDLLLDIEDFVSMGTLTTSEAEELKQLIEERPGVLLEGQERGLSIDSEGALVSRNTYLLLEKQIKKMAYDSETIEQMVTDFRITGVLSRDEFMTLSEMIEELYFPVYNETEALPPIEEEEEKPIKQTKPSKKEE